MATKVSFLLTDIATILAGEVARVAPFLWPPGTPKRNSQAAAECSILIGGSRDRLNLQPNRPG